MNKIELKGLDVCVYNEVLDNGLSIYLIPIENKKNYIMNYVTNFGSINTEFIPDGEKEYIKVPDGIAHFLEHKMFEQEDGMDPFAFASQSGTYSNASTNFIATQYYFEGNKSFNENLDYLLDFVGSPYFTDSNVEKEKGIIAEEIKQYDDEVSWFIEEELYKALLVNDNHRIDIAGTVESINKITKDDLYKTYYTFYKPSNMFLIISGNFDKDEALKIIKNNGTLKNNKSSNKKIKCKKINEPVMVNEKKKKLSFNIVNSKMAYGIKIPTKNYDRLILNMYLRMLLKEKFGSTSLFRERMKDNKMFTSFVSDIELIDDYLLITFKADTDKCDEVVSEIKKELNDFEIDEAAIERIKRVWISAQVMITDDISMMLDSVESDILTYNKVINNRLDIYKSLNKKDYMKVISSIDFNNSSLVIINPKKN